MVITFAVFAIINMSKANKRIDDAYDKANSFMDNAKEQMYQQNKSNIIFYTNSKM